jgi:hypothetical protein
MKWKQNWDEVFMGEMRDRGERERRKKEGRERKKMFRDRKG